MGDEKIELNREVGEIKAMMTMMLKSIDDLKLDLRSSYATKGEVDDLKNRVTKLESVPRQWLPIIIAGIAAIISYFK